MAIAAILQAPDVLGLSLHRFAELALLAGCALIPAVYAAIRGLGYADAKAALFVACALVGLPLLRAAAIYQLEGYSFGFLLAWGLICLVPATLSGLGALWLLALALLNLGLFQIWGAPTESGDFARPAALFGLNALWLVAIWAGSATDGWRAALWFERTALAFTSWCGVVVGYFGLVTLTLPPFPEHTAYLLATAPAALGALAIAVAAARRYLRRRDLSSLAVMATSNALAVIVVPIIELWGVNFCTVPLLFMACVLVLSASLVITSGTRRVSARLNGSDL